MMKNKLYFGDCLDILKELHIENPKGFIDLIYIDPPLTDTKAQKQAFSDTWSSISYIDTLNQIYDLNLDLYQLLKTLDKLNLSKSIISYLSTISIRIYYIHKVLKETGSFYLHCDPTMSHYLKIVCDLIFGVTNCRNELVWCYEGRQMSKKYWNTKHDIILFYTKSKNYTFNWEAVGESLKESSKKALSRFQDETGRYYVIRYKKGGGFAPKDAEGETTYRQYVPDKIPPKDWFILDYARKSERLGYPTQKPEALLERIIKASSNKGDLIADFFCGCGTTIAVAEKLKRNWIGVDISHLAIKLILDRLIKPYKNKEKRLKIRDSIIVNGFPKDIASAKELAKHTKKGRIKFQDWIVEVMLGGVSNPKKTADGGYDGYITFYKTTKQKEIVLIEVKSGKLGVKNIREFIQVINRQEADMGIFVCFEEYLTKPMLLEAKKEGYYSDEFHYDKIQIITIEDLLDDKLPQIPESIISTFKQATKKFEEDNTQLDLTSS